MSRERVIDETAHRLTEYASIANFLATDNVPAGISTLWEGGLPIDFLVSPASSDTTIFFFHGAIEQHFVLPVLSGLGISGGLDANRVFVSDPSLILDETLMLAWYAGNSHQPRLQKILTKILKKIANSLGSKRVVFFGGSGGGFASLYFASHFEDSLALVFNPQTNIAKYSRRAVRDFAVKGFGVKADLENPLQEIPREVELDICQIYKNSRGVTIAYMQNYNDTSHLRSHLRPFLGSVHPSNEVLLMKELWKDGHSPPPKKLLSQVLDLAALSTDWGKDFSDIGFVRMPALQDGTI